MFFTQINQMMGRGVDITLVIRKKEGHLTVSVMPKSNGLKDEAQNHIVPLNVTGTPEELDMGFIPTICRPVQKVAGLLANMEQFEQQAGKAAANSKAAEEQKKKEAKEAKEKKEKFDKLMKSASELETARKYSEALATLQQAKNHATSQSLKTVDDKINSVRRKMSQGSLFEMDPNPTPEQMPQPAQAGNAREIQYEQPAPRHADNPYPVGNNTRQPVQRPVDGYENGGYAPANNGQQPYQQQQAYQPQQAQPQGYGSYHHGGQQAKDDIADQEPQLEITADYSAHREGEYDQYPDFPGYPHNNMYNQ